jgi:competence protein ComEC
VAGSRAPLLLVAAVAAIAVLALTHAGEIRDRAEVALEAGMPAPQAELARGFVLGQDDRIDSRTVEDFRRSGLAHLLAVSGQNVALLALLAMPLLAALGIPSRMRLVWVLALIALYVPLAGAGPSIQRAGVMGALTVLATIAGRRSSRLYALAVAALVTLAIEPRIAADVGWQLSFAAVLGILAVAGPLREALAARIGGHGLAGALADGAAMTIAATVATAPLIAFHFGALSTTTLLANLLALPAVAPAMWLGMLAAAAGQVPGFPVEAINALNAPLLAYVAEVAARCGRPGWAYPQVHLGAGGLLAAYLGIAAAMLAVARWRRRRRIAASRHRGERGGKASPPAGQTRRRAVPGRVIVALGLVALVLFQATGGDGEAAPPAAGLRVTALDVGQGDAILLQPPRAAAILVDTGPAGSGVATKLEEAGVSRLGAVIVTHDQSDHSGGLAELLTAIPVERVLHGVLDRETSELIGGVATARLAAGDRVRAGALRLEVLWPPRELLVAPGAVEDPNALAIITVARWRHFSILLSADAEAESVPIDSGPVDVLKVAHHGSVDAGLGELLERVGPKLAIVSVGEGNPFGHPSAETLATLASHGVRTLRTDQDGAVILDVTAGGIAVRHGGL